MSMERQL